MAMKLYALVGLVESRASPPGHDTAGRARRPSTGLELFRDSALFALRSQDAIDRIRSALTGLVVMAHLHFSKQADGEHIQPRQQQHHRKHHQRAVLIHDVGVVQYLLPDQPDGNRAARKDAEHPHRAKEMQRSRKIFEQEADSNKIKEDAEGARDSVMRRAAFPVYVLDGNFDDRRAMPRGQCRNEAVKLPVERNLSQDFAAVSLKSRAKVVDVDPTQLGHEPVSAAGGNAPQPEIVHAILAPAADNVVALRNLLQK